MGVASLHLNIADTCECESTDTYDQDPIPETQAQSTGAQASDHRV